MPQYQLGANVRFVPKADTADHPMAVESNDLAQKSKM